MFTRGFPQFPRDIALERESDALSFMRGRERQQHVAESVSRRKRIAESSRR